MHPILVTIGSIQIRTYSLMAFLAMMAAMTGVLVEAKRLKWDLLSTAWQVIACTLVGFLGSHLFYSFTRWDLSGAAWWRMFFNVGYGQVWFGGFLCSWALCEFNAKRLGIPSLQMWDMAAFAVLLANPVGRTGCLFGGCCYGTPTTLPWGIILRTPEFGTTAVHPVPLYEFLYQMSLFALLWSMRKRNRHDGQTAARYLIFMPLGRFLLEFLRGDTVRGFVWGWLSTSQTIALGLMTAGLLLYAIQRRKHKTFTLF